MLSDEEADELLRALAHPARRAILRRCWLRRVSAGALSAGLELAPASASEHLKVLRKLGLVVLTAEGTFRWYQAVPERVAAVSHWLTNFTDEGADMSNPIVHIDIAGPDEEAQRRFYAELFGWTVAPQGPGYALVTTPKGSPDGALVEAEAGSVAFGVAVADLDASIAQAVRLGGSVIMPTTDNGWVVKAQVCDPAGNLVTLIQS